MLIQTASLGQSELRGGQPPQPDFRGCRCISVTVDMIDCISDINFQNIQRTLAASLLYGGIRMVIC